MILEIFAGFSNIITELLHRSIGYDILTKDNLQKQKRQCDMNITNIPGYVVYKNLNVYEPYLIIKAVNIDKKPRHLNASV